MSSDDDQPGGSVARPEWRVNRAPFDAPPGWKILLPGWTQCSWHQPERGLVLLGSFLSGTIASLWTWGTWVSISLIVFVFATHVAATMDAMHQVSFPIYRRRRTLVLCAGALALVVYLPAACILSATAWPGLSADTSGSGYLVNCWAYRQQSPRPGDWIWLRMPPAGTPHGAEVVAVSGQEVEWTGRKWRVDGRDCHFHSVLHPEAWPQACRFQVPKDQILVEPESEGGCELGSQPLLLVSADRIIGRAWARYYPVWDRQLL